MPIRNAIVQKPTLILTVENRCVPCCSTVWYYDTVFVRPRRKSVALYTNWHTEHPVVAFDDVAAFPLLLMYP